MPESEARAARRRASWKAEIVEAGQAKGPSYAALSPVERLRALTALNARVWKAAGVAASPSPRSEWPGEIFELRSGG